MVKSALSTQGRADRVSKGLWRIRMPLPWTGVPHVNAYAVEYQGGLLLIDTGADEVSSHLHLAQALDQIGYRIEDIKLLICTHTHPDHYGLAKTIVEQAQCPLWLGADYHYITSAFANPEATRKRRAENITAGGMPSELVEAYSGEKNVQKFAVAGVVEPERILLEGDQIETDIGSFRVITTPGHSPCHICLYQPESGVLISGDHLIGTNIFYYEFGLTPDPVGDYLNSLVKLEPLDLKLCLGGHGRPFREVKAHVAAIKAMIEGRLEATLLGLAEGERNAYQLLPAIYGEWLNELTLSWALSKQMCHLEHLRLNDRVQVREDEATGVQWWSAK